VTAGVYNAVVEVVVECLKMLLGTKGRGCTCRRSDAQVSRDQRMRV